MGAGRSVGGSACSTACAGGGSAVLAGVAQPSRWPAVSLSGGAGCRRSRRVSRRCCGAQADRVRGCAAREAGRDTVFYGGGKLAADLSLPKLQDRAQLWRQATEAAARAAEQVRQHAGSSQVEQMTSAGDAAAAAAAEVLSAASRLIEGEAGGPLTQAARDYDRASREVRGRLPEPTVAGAMLRTATLQLARGGKSGRNEGAQIALLVAQIGSLSLSVSLLRQAQGGAAQTAAARRAATSVADSAEHWAGEARGLVDEQTSGRRGGSGTAVLDVDAAAARADAGTARARSVALQASDVGGQAHWPDDDGLPDACGVAARRVSCAGGARRCRRPGRRLRAARGSR